MARLGAVYMVKDVIVVIVVIMNTGNNLNFNTLKTQVFVSLYINT